MFMFITLKDNIILIVSVLLNHIDTQSYNGIIIPLMR